MQEYLADGAAVVVQAALEGTPEGGRLGGAAVGGAGDGEKIKAGNVKATIFRCCLRSG